ncbi:hypothetical protein QR680_013160 [Steinernema hermaphroditum]|uniref:Uncharacterized protein n=1 Tax=Steinernema hermaphroditum TaxID=289476 RepID=A0AA39I6W4_9BILA|nr:hypothetical protein QR680_013160 [Steinernema hermaphroditum]
MNQRFAAASTPPTRESKCADFDNLEEGHGPAATAILGSAFPVDPSRGSLYPLGHGKQAGTSSAISAARFGTPTRIARIEGDDSCWAQLKKIADCLRFKNGPHFQTLTNTNSPRGTLRPEEHQPETETASMKIRNAHRRKIRKYVYYAQAALIAIVLCVYVGWRIIDYSRAPGNAANSTDSPPLSFISSSLATVTLSAERTEDPFPRNATDGSDVIVWITSSAANTVASDEKQNQKAPRKMISAVASKKNSDNLVEFADSP